MAPICTHSAAVTEMFNLIIKLLGITTVKIVQIIAVFLIRGITTVVIKVLAVLRIGIMTELTVTEAALTI